MTVVGMLFHSRNHSLGHEIAFQIGCEGHGSSRLVCRQKRRAFQEPNKGKKTRKQGWGVGGWGWGMKEVGMWGRDWV